MKLEDINTKIDAGRLPDAPGVYFFVSKKAGDSKKAGNDSQTILYIGRATSLRDRVRSYFRDDVISTRGSLIVDMVTQADDVETIETDSVLEAIILEANLIKKYQPHANTMEKDDKSFNYVIITQEDFPRILLIRGKDLDERYPKNRLKYVFGPYVHGGPLKEGLKIIRRIFPYRDTCVPFIEKSPEKPAKKKSSRPSVGKPCFNRQIGLCPGVCTGEISKKDYARTVQSLKLFFQGKKQELIRKLEREMKAYAKMREFEQANRAKKTIFALTHIQDISLIKDESYERKQVRDLEGIKDIKSGTFVPSHLGVTPETAFRIEGYDVAHTGGGQTVGVMTVLEDRHIKKSDYRMFKIGKGRPGEASAVDTKHTKLSVSQKSAINDIASLKEIIARRLNHAEWPFPNLIVVDGGKAQQNAAEELLTERGFDIAVVAVTKNYKHRPDHVLGDSALAERYSKEILLVNSEAHRFAIKFHRRLRGKNLLGAR